MSEWKKIETAPHHFDTPLLVAWKEEDGGDGFFWDYAVASWQAMEHVHLENPEDEDEFGVLIKSFGWLRLHEGGRPEEELFPTHWKPIEEPEKCS